MMGNGCAVSVSDSNIQCVALMLLSMRNLMYIIRTAVW